ncbi:glucose 1-dehydrogenase [uncultured Muribaculum sp.]|uniref:glucose 1-dehydrogenase n=1 Tax=uncultured Muribaculum sp. TaxID=1918613 RepID=UPI002591024D|nr:glucose 1-dehydrogenase [uncultured Muribaculum sp.]
MKIDELFDLTGKVAVVTGGGDGIGKGVCEILASAGASVVVSNRTLSRAETVANVINNAGGRAVPFACDVLDDAALVALVDFAVSAFGTVNVLVNNAGMGGGGRENPFQIDRAYVERLYAMNVVAPWRLCQLAVPHMNKSGYGSIVNITSMSSINNDPGMSIYGSSKAALNHMASNLAYDFGPMGIRINCVGPGATRTHALSTVLTPEIEHKMLQHTPIKRLGEVSDIAGAVLYFAAPVSEWVSGQVLLVNGGGVQTLD